MKRAVDSRAVQGVLYGVYKALYNIAGASAAAVMRQAAPDILHELGQLGVSFDCVDDVDKLSSKIGETMEKTGMCDKMVMTLDGDRLRADITNCAFFDLTMHLKEEGIPPFGCPFAALTIAIAEKNLGKRARLVNLEPTPGGNPGDTRLEVQLF
ncbi:MAG: hypothetical protein JXR76_14190 [Deltaproteobacteria bacterium]|nr:hypothetical protein [Deltaproteobacteria bacterium]